MITLQTASGNFTKFTTTTLVQLETKIKQITFWGQNVKDQGHSETSALFFRRRHTDLRFDVNQRPVCPRFCPAGVCLQSYVLSTWNPQTNNLVCVFFVLTTF